MFACSCRGIRWRIWFLWRFWSGRRHQWWRAWWRLLESKGGEKYKKVRDAFPIFYNLYDVHATLCNEIFVLLRPENKYFIFLQNKLVGVINLLQNALKEEKKKVYITERNVREEMLEEMDQQVVDIENKQSTVCQVDGTWSGYELKCVLGRFLIFEIGCFPILNRKTWSLVLYATRQELSHYFCFKYPKICGIYWND